MSGDWRTLVPEEAWAAHRAAGYGAPLRLGSRPALVVVDATLAFVGPEGATRAEAVARYAGACGPPAWEAVTRAASLLQRARELDLPVAYTIGPNPAWVAWAGRPQHASASPPPADARDIVAPLRPLDGELVLDKLRPSAFYATPLLPLLIARRVDTVILAGGTTSGCVRATALDAFSAGLACVVAEDAVFDRSAFSHAAALFELSQKYADVLPLERVLARLADLEPRTHRAAAGPVDDTPSSAADLAP